MAPVAQAVPEDPKLLFSPDNYAEPTYLGHRLCAILGGASGFFGTIFHNYSMRRPHFAGVPYIVGFTILGAAAGHYYQRRSDLYFAEKDAVYRHYIELHPEDFPAKERILIGDMFKPWVPIR